MAKIIGINKNNSTEYYDVSEVICIKCHKRWICARPQEVLLKNIECEKCGQGHVIETGEILNKTNQ